MKSSYPLPLLAALVFTAASLSAQTYTFTTLAGSNSGGHADGPGSVAGFFNPSAVAVDSSGNVFVADTYNCTIRKITPAGLVTTLAGQANSNINSADGTGSAARFQLPGGVALDGSGNLYLADTGNHTIRKITAGGVVTTLAGLAGTPGSTDGPGSAARFNLPNGVALDSAGNLFVADESNGTIRKITAGGMVTRLAGLAGTGSFTSLDGTGSASRFGGPSGLAVDASGNLFVTDGTTVRKTTAAGVVTTLAGVAGSGGFMDGTGTAVRVNFPQGVAVDRAGNLYVTDSAIVGKIRKGVPVFAPLVAVQPQPVTVATGSTAVFSVTSTGTDLTYQWKNNTVALAGATTATLVVPNAQARNAGAYTCDISNVAGTIVSAAATLTLSGTVDVGRLTNLAIRSPAGTGAQTLIVGFTLSGGPPGASQPLLVRGIGPALATFGVIGVLADPALNIYQDNLVIASNDDWGGGSALASVFASVGAFPLTPATGKDAALYNPAIPPGSYTVQLTGNAGTTDVALAEIYDATPAGTFSSTTPRLTNVSARTQVGTGSDLLIAGFSIGGSTAKTVLIRAAGPALAPFGVTGVLADPKLELYSGQTLVAANDNWGAVSAQTIADVAASVGAFSFGNTSGNDAALLITLPPGAYTAQVSGVASTTGVALVEVYDVP